jgi:hypothetical protein
MQNKMTALEAISILDQATAQLSADRKTHLVVQTALQTLREAVEAKKEVKTVEA